MRRLLPLALLLGCLAGGLRAQQSPHPARLRTARGRRDSFAAHACAPIWLPRPAGRSRLPALPVQERGAGISELPGLQVVDLFGRPITPRTADHSPPPREPRRHRPVRSGLRIRSARPTARTPCRLRIALQLFRHSAGDHGAAEPALRRRQDADLRARHVRRNSHSAQPDRYRPLGPDGYLPIPGATRAT